MPVRYIGSGPYCYANSLAMVLHPDAPDPSLIEVLTGSPFGANITDGLAFFDPPGWNPDIGLDAAIAALGWRCGLTSGGSAAEAVMALRTAVAAAPVLVGPMEMGLLRHHPGSGRPVGEDHFMVVIGVNGGTVLLHDPHGYPFATLPLEAFVAAWRAESIRYARPFTMRYGFTRNRHVDPLDAVRSSLPAAVRWLQAPGAPGCPPAGTTLCGTAAVHRLAGWIEDGLPGGAHGHLVRFAVRVGVRRLADTSYWLTEIGHHTAAGVADRQARLVGALRYALVSGDREAAVATLRSLAPTYEQMLSALMGGAGMAA